MKILISGVHGFIGSNLTNSLSLGKAIYGLDIIFPTKDGIVKTYSWKNLENKTLPEVDVIIHLAGKAHDTKNQSEAQSYFDINTELTKRILDYFLSTSAKKFIFFSSVKAVADTVDGAFLTEEVVPNPKGPYGESKVLAEKYIQENWPAQNSDKSVFILRPCMIHGPGNKGNLNLLYKVVNKRIPWPLGAFDNRRSFTSIDNLCFVIDRLISENSRPGVYHIADDEPLSTNELIQVICETMGRKARIWYLPQKLMNGVARLGGLLHLPLNEERLHKLTENYVVSNAKIKEALGIKRMPVSAKEGLRRTIKAFKK